MDLDVVQYQPVISICDVFIARPWSCLIGFLSDEELVFLFTTQQLMTSKIVIYTAPLLQGRHQGVLISGFKFYNN